MSYKIYQIDFFSITIFYEKDEIIINIIDDQRNSYELIINDKNLHTICIFNLTLNTVFDYYEFLIMSFENIEKYKIIILNKNYKFIRLTIKEYITETISNVVNILWIKNKTNENNSNEYNENITINFEEKKFYEETFLITDHYTIIDNNIEDNKNSNDNFVKKICSFIYNFFKYKN